MELLDALDTYFRGERALGFAFVAVGLGLFAMAGGGAFLAIKTDAQIESLRAQHTTAPATMEADEVERMQRVNAN